MSIETSEAVKPSRSGWLNARRSTVILAALTLLVLLLSHPGAIREALESGRLYLFSRDFFADIPKRLTGPGRFRFILQPLVAIILGIRSGRLDARQGRPPYLKALIMHREHRREMAREGLQTVANLMLMGILMDAISQWLILGVSHPGAALVVGPVLILLPYSLARALSNRMASRRIEADAPR
jgi:hypothetical protein